MKKEIIEVSESKGKQFLLQDIAKLDLDKISYKDLVELKIAILKLNNNSGKLYRKGFFSDAYEPIEDCEIELDEKITEKIANETREFVRKNISYFKNLMSSSRTIEEFADQLDEEPDNDILIEHIYTGSFGMELNFALVVDEETALRANVMLFEGKSKKEIQEFVSKNNTTPYVDLISPYVCLSFCTGEKYHDGSDANLLSSFPTFIKYDELLIDLNVLCDELAKFGFEINYARYSAKTPSEIIASLAYTNEDYIGLMDTSLEITEDNKTYMTFPNQKVK